MTRLNGYAVGAPGMAVTFCPTPQTSRLYLPLPCVMTVPGDAPPELAYTPRSEKCQSAMNSRNRSFAPEQLIRLLCPFAENLTFLNRS